jgi:hypothetical protein
LEAIDPATECVVEGVAFDVDNLDALREIIGAEAEESFAGSWFDLNDDEFRKLARRFGVAFDPGGLPVSLRSTSPLDDLPYRIHTGRELLLMRAGIKPLAYFCESYPESNGYKIPEHLFNPDVVEGRFVKREFVMVGGRSGDPERPRTRVVLYALTHEEWRIDAFTLVLDTAAKTGWNETLERMTGSLLGYTEWQNDAFLEHARLRAMDKPEPDLNSLQS